MSYLATIPCRVAGIPCLIGVTTCEITRGTFSRHTDSDWDYYGHTEIEFDVLDRRGRISPWLQKKLDDDAESEIEQIIITHMKDNDD